MADRTYRTRIASEIGQMLTLPEGPEAFERLGRGKRVVFLGLGPRPKKLAEDFPAVRKALFVEAPQFEERMGRAWTEAVPNKFTRLPAEEATAEVLAGSTVLRYRQGLRLFPSFWAPLWARCLGLPAAPADPPRQRTVWLPGGDRDLLCQELAEAFATEGLCARIVPPEPPGHLAGRIRQEGRPDLFFSVNFKGLDALGETQALLAEAGAAVAAWCVDNPFHLLSGQRSRAWTRLSLFVTDQWFIGPLRRLGAESAHHLPLAAGRPFLRAAENAAPPLRIEGRLVFVGRSEFPHKQDFFAGCRLPQAPWSEALAMLSQGRRPDFGWWLTRLGIDRPWPGNEVRRAGFCAEETGQAWRTLCLASAGQALTVFGDAGWKTLLPEAADIRPPVDYYTTLPGVYRQAGCSLNLTSPLLPAGLTQRHFDVWAAGGLLLSDDTPGLSIFPPRFVHETTFTRPEGLRPLCERFLADPALSLRAAWREHIREAHTYGARVRRVLALSGLDRGGVSAQKGLVGRGEKG